MRHTILAFVCVASASLSVQAADIVRDPIADYLRMDVAERVDFLAPLDHVNRVTIDVNGDKQDEVFVGAPYKYSGTMEVF